ncbi:hypothetical protein C8J57DRAFT_1565248 [Mycena rebaudengoi]|nr:hypothetical protein C8J57DRAFT_1565248 [Mycena rebaudengoi]
MELALRRRIGIVRDPMSRRTPLTERPVTVLSTRQTGETLLDETLKMMKQTEDSGKRMGVATWADLLSAMPRTYVPYTPVPIRRTPRLGACSYARSLGEGRLTWDGQLGTWEELRPLRLSSGRNFTLFYRRRRGCVVVVLLLVIADDGGERVGAASLRPPRPSSSPSL